MENDKFENFIFGWVLEYMGFLPPIRTADDEIYMAKKMRKKDN